MFSRISFAVLCALGLAACGPASSQMPSDEDLLSAHPGGTIFVSGETFENQIDCPVPEFLYGEGEGKGRQVARGVSIPVEGAADNAVRRYGLWHYYHVAEGAPMNEQENLAARGEFDNGDRVGPWEFWYSSGNRRAKGSFVAGKMDGPWDFWTRNGGIDPDHTGTYRDNEKVE